MEKPLAAQPKQAGASAEAGCRALQFGGHQDPDLVVDAVEVAMPGAAFRDSWEAQTWPRTHWGDANVSKGASARARQHIVGREEDSKAQDRRVFASASRDSQEARWAEDGARHFGMAAGSIVVPVGMRNAQRETQRSAKREAEVVVAVGDP